MAGKVSAEEEVRAPSAEHETQFMVWKPTGSVPPRSREGDPFFSMLKKLSNHSRAIF